jgi:hypothetical protein
VNGMITYVPASSHCPDTRLRTADCRRSRTFRGEVRGTSFVHWMSSVPVSFGARAAKGRVARWLLQLVLIMSFFVKGTALFLEKSIAEVLTMYASEMPCWRKSIPVLRVLVKLFCQLAKIHNRVTQ